MQRFSSISVIVVLICMVGLLGCGGGKKPVEPALPEESTNLPGIPAWWSSVADDPNYLLANTTSSSKDLQMAINKAAQEGRVQIAQQVQTKVSGLMKQFMEDTGVGEDSEILAQSENVSKSIVSESLSGSKINKQEIKEEGTLYRAYIQMNMPIGEANLALRNNIKKNQLLYQRFRASQAYQNLDGEIEKFEEWKKQQNQ
mgnify:CR=1 FL=1